MHERLEKENCPGFQKISNSFCQLVSISAYNIEVGKIEQDFQTFTLNENDKVLKPRSSHSKNCYILVVKNIILHTHT